MLYYLFGVLIGPAFTWACLYDLSDGYVGTKAGHFSPIANPIPFWLTAAIMLALVILFNAWSFMILKCTRKFWAAYRSGRLMEFDWLF